MKKTLLIIFLTSLVFNRTFADDLQIVKDNVNNMRSAVRAPGILGDIFTKIFDTNGKIKETFLTLTNNAVEGYVPMWNGLQQLVNSPLYSTGTMLGIGTTTLTETLTLSGGLSITKDPDSGDDVGDRDYNDLRYQLDIGAVTCANGIASINDLGIVVCASSEGSTFTTNYIPKSNGTSLVDSDILGKY